MPKGKDGRDAGEITNVKALETSGVDNQFFEASGSVDLQSPSRQVLSDWMRYEFSIDTIKARGNVVIRSWQDLIEGPESCQAARCEQLQ